MNPEPPFEEEFRRMSRRSFLWAGLAVGAAVSAWQAIVRSPRSGGMPAPLRAVSEFNGALWQRLFRPTALAPTYDPALAGARYNGDIGLRSPLDLEAWRLRVEGLPAGERELTLDDLRALPRTEQTTEFMCVEGWSQIVTFAGVRMLDFVAAVGPRSADDLPPWVALETPDGRYAVAIDTPSALHPQTLLAYEMNGKPLTERHGAPLRLAMPVKYGFKQIKRIGRLRFVADRPPDYWRERGYDGHAGL